MNLGELNSLLDLIHTTCRDIAKISEHVVINKIRSAKMGEYATFISKGISSLATEPNIRNQRISDAILLLSISLEDVRSFLENYTVLNKELAISIIKGGSHFLEFIKLTEQLQHCCALVNLDVDMTVDDGFNRDCSDLIAQLPVILKVIFKDTERNSLHNFVGKTRSLINEQMATKKTYRAKRSRNDDVTMRSDDLELLKPCGKGGFSTVWLAKYRGEHVAIKVLSVESSNITVQEFKHEADLMRRLSNKNIVAYYGVTEIYNTRISGHCMIMEYMANDSLFTYIKNNRSSPVNWSRKVDIALDIASGIAFLHRLRIIHRDIKLGNILLDEHLHAKVADFGMSFAKTSANSTYNMNEGGTIPYMAPECFGMNAAYSTKSDVFAFAIVCWGLMHWELPFSSYDRDAIKDMVWKERFRLPIDAKIPMALSSMIKLSWQQSYSHRPTMTEIKQFLERVVFIDGIELENPIFATEMTTTATVLDNYASPKKQGNAHNELNSSIGNVTGTKPVKTSFPKRKKCFFAVVALLAIFVVAGAVLLSAVLKGQSANFSHNPSTTFLSTNIPVTQASGPTATVTTFATDYARLGGIHGITIDDEDNLYVISPSSLDIHKVSAINGTITFITNLSNDGQGLPYPADQGICYFNNSLYVPRVNQLTKIDLSNNVTTVFAGSNDTSSPLAFQNTSTCAIDKSGNIYISEAVTKTIRKISPSGVVSADKWQILMVPVSLLFDDKGHLLYTGWSPSAIFSLDFRSTNSAILVGDRNNYDVSAPRRNGQGTDSRPKGISGMAFGKDKNLYITETVSQVISKVNSSNYLSNFTGSGLKGNEDGVGPVANFSSPRGLVVDSQGRLFVADQFNAAIRMITW